MIGKIAKINIDKAKEAEKQHLALVEWAERGIYVKIETEPMKLNDLSNTTIVGVRALDGYGIKGISMPTLTENLDIITNLDEYPFWEKVKKKIKLLLKIGEHKR